jgi:hypothetical protein
VPMAGFAPAACALPLRCTSRCASTAKWHPRSESNTRNPPSEGRRRSSVGVGMNWHSPKSLGHGQLGCSPGCRAQPFPVIRQVSRAYKARPHAGADYKWMWRVDLHHHRQAYETCAPLFVLRHRRGENPMTVHQRPPWGSLLYALTSSARSCSAMKRTTASDQPSTCSHLP